MESHICTILTLGQYSERWMGEIHVIKKNHANERDIFMAMTFTVSNLYDFFSHMCFTINFVFSMPKMQSQQTHVHATIKHNTHCFHSMWQSVD